MNIKNKKKLKLIFYISLIILLLYMNLIYLVIYSIFLISQLIYIEKKKANSFRLEKIPFMVSNLFKL